MSIEREYIDKHVKVSLKGHKIKCSLRNKIKTYFAWTGYKDINSSFWKPMPMNSFILSAHRKPPLV